jgi:hypothetical protein
VVGPPWVREDMSLLLNITWKGSRGILSSRTHRHNGCVPWCQNWAGWGERVSLKCSNSRHSLIRITSTLQSGFCLCNWEDITGLLPVIPTVRAAEWSQSAVGWPTSLENARGCILNNQCLWQQLPYTCCILTNTHTHTQARTRTCTHTHRTLRIF